MAIPSERPTKISARPKDSGFSAVAPTAAAPEPPTAIPAPMQARPVDRAAAKVAYWSTAPSCAAPAARTDEGDASHTTASPAANIPTKKLKVLNPVTILETACAGLVFPF